jgi:uncharacterized membrane protein
LIQNLEDTTEVFAPSSQKQSQRNRTHVLRHYMASHGYDALAAEIDTTNYLSSIYHGQLISILISGTGFFASLLSSRRANCPILLSMINYLLLSLNWIRLLYTRSNSKIKTKSLFTLSLPWWVYLTVAIFDVEANILVNTAYNYTSITSIMLLDCFSIPCVILLSIFFLNARFTRPHLMGVGFCLIGMGCIIASDTFFQHNKDIASNPLLGDILCLVRVDFPLLFFILSFFSPVVWNLSVCSQ